MKTTHQLRPGFASAAMRSRTLKIAALTLAAAALAGCRHLDDPVDPTTFSLVDPSERHPIIVSQQPKDVTVRVARGSSGLAPAQRASLIEFLRRYRAGDSGNSKLVIQVPSGTANEVASMHAVGEIRQLVSDQGFEDSMVAVEAFQADRGAQPPIRVSYLRYVAEAPECGRWPTNLAREPYNLPYPNMGCATQRNFASMVANPADLVGPRSMTPGPGDRRHAVWGKYIQGEQTTARKSEDEKVRTDSKN
jgi:pilus assembly protein CpaD